MPRYREPVDVLLAKERTHLTQAEIDHRRLAEMEAPNTRIDAPGYLTAKQKKRFDELVCQLLQIGRQGIIADVDSGALGRYVVAEDNYARITKSIQKLTKSGFYYSKELISLVNAQDKLYKQCRAGAADLGLCITSRCRISIPGDNNEDEEHKENPFAAFASDTSEVCRITSSLRPDGSTDA